MLSSSCAIRACSLRSVKFLSRLLTALNLLPSIATMPSVKSFSRRQSSTNSRQTSRMALPWSLRKSAIVLKSGQAPSQPHELDVALRFALQPSARLDSVQVAVDVDLEQDRRVIRRSASGRGLGAFESELVKLQPFNEHVDHPDGIVLGDVVV